MPVAVATAAGLEPLAPNETRALARGLPACMAMLIRYFGLDGRPFRTTVGAPPFFRVRFLYRDTWDLITGRRSRRYAQPRGTGVAAYFPPNAGTNWKKIAADATRPLNFTEGEVKALCATKLGFPTIGLGGVYSFRGKNQTLLPELERFAWDGRTVYIAYDSDAVDNANIRRAESRLAAELTRRGANVRIVRLPSLSDDGKTGLDDFIVAKGKAAKKEVTRLLEAAQPAEIADYRPTDVGNGERFVRDHGPDVRFVCNRKGWRWWDDLRWARNDRRQVERRATETAKSIYAEASRERSEEEAKKIAKHAAYSGSDHGIRAMLNRAGAIEGIAVTSEIFDTNRYLLNFPNGTLDLWSGEFYDHRREDLITRVLPYEYDPAARCPRWLRFLDQTFKKDAELIAFVRRAVGYSLTGSVEEQAFLLLYGTGANGKSTFIETIAAALGPYAQTARFESFLVKPGNSASNDVARMRGARFVSAIEADAGRRLDEATVKQLTGGDTVTARMLYEEYEQFRPEFKLWLSANSKPVIRGTDEAIWRRVRLIPFDVTIPPRRRDPKLAQKLRAELPGIMAWAIEGCRAWRENGLGSCDAVDRASIEYRREQDTLGGFLDERCVVGPEYEVEKVKLYAAYHGWAETSGLRPVAENVLARQLRERSPDLRDRRGTRSASDRSRSRLGRVWLGIGLREGRF